MSANGISRRDVLRTLAVGAAGGVVMQVIPAEAAAFAHRAIQKEKAASPAGKYAPKYFTPSQYETIVNLCDLIIPRDERCGGAVEGGAPEFIDLLTSENDRYQAKLGGGLMWLDYYCSDRYGAAFLGCTPDQKKTTLDLIAFRKNAETDPSISQGVSFFSFLRKLTCDGYYTSKVGIGDLQYIGNAVRGFWPGCEVDVDHLA